MPASLTSVFSEPADFAAALCEDHGLDLLIIGRGQFRARLTQVKPGMCHGSDVRLWH